MKDKKQINWTIKYDEAQGLWTASTENGICVYADKYEKLRAWLGGNECGITAPE